MQIVPEDQIPIGQDITDKDKMIELYADLVRYARTNGFPLGLSAVQLGLPYKFFIARCPLLPEMFGEDETTLGYIGYANTTYVPAKNIGEVILVEGCLSLPGKLYKLKRFANITITGQIMSVDPETLEVDMVDLDKVTIANSYFATILQHEIDHQHGILISHLGERFEVNAEV